MSVTDKTGLAELARALRERGLDIIASSGTKKYLDGEGIECREISEYTESPEILGGRVKTLHPKIHGGILANRDDHTHMQTLMDMNIDAVDFVVGDKAPVLGGTAFFSGSLWVLFAPFDGAGATS